MSVEVEVTFDDVNGDSASWLGSAEKLRSLAGSLEDRDLPNSAFMMAGYSFAMVYRSFIRQLDDRLQSDADQAEGVSQALANAVESYETTDQQIIARVRAVSARLEG